MVTVVGIDVVVDVGFGVVVGVSLFDGEVGGFVVVVVAVVVVITVVVVVGAVVYSELDGYVG